MFLRIQREAVIGSPGAGPTSARQLKNRRMPILGRPGPRDDALLVELADDRPVLDRRKLQLRMPGARHAVRDIRGLLAVEEHDVAWQAEIAARPIHPTQLTASPSNGPHSRMLAAVLS